jgi:hypothetical protein
MSITAEPGGAYELAVRLFDEDSSVAVMCKGNGWRTAALAPIIGASEYGLKYAIHCAVKEAIDLWKLKQESV